MIDFEEFCCNIPCIVRVHNWEPHRRARVSGPADHWSPEEGGYGDWEILTRKGQPAPWLEKKMMADPNECMRLAAAVFDRMENYPYDDDLYL
jgi:hypothetical protein